MKKLVSLAPLRKLRPGRKALLVMGYLLVVGILLVAVTYNGIFTEPLTQAPADPGAAETGVEDDAGVANPPFNALDEEEEKEDEVLTEEEAIAALALPDGPMLWPLEGEILIGHHEPYKVGSQWRAHAGLNLEASLEDEVLAAWPGIVEYVGNDSRLGWFLEIRHGGDYITKYANLKEEPYVIVGDEVDAGDLIGIVGDSARLGASEGAFLHFVVYQDQDTIDPVGVLSPH
ncbi:M23 family metallopeptidase [Dethiobacter alkaliphilus]|uniref:M23 family metallopeptidase n=1 Tax=Dethiobacter alkaliphilus TaxID=427926 RepID=UPI002227DEDD|nr:M23 family metallopeptidase [Dethiobacter alkaliphilus]MCW3488847.1 M23 family metallopeptidase [Dethiobacter alkaliphilus]